MKQAMWLSPVLAASLIACQPEAGKQQDLAGQGVSKELAEFRKANVQDVEYELSFSIPEARSEAVTGSVLVRWRQEGAGALVLDFRGDSAQVESCRLNRRDVPYQIKNEHIVIDADSAVVPAGTNEVQVVFRTNDRPLNRRDDFLYTLLVPDRARTLFPCFDQPDIKARYTLSLEMPAHWTAVANGAVASLDTLSRPGRKQVTFRETEPLSTYLFSFVAGELEQETFSRNGRSISLFHRETDPKKAAQCPEIARQVFDALEWMEDYTQVAYPFAKYDLIILPGFQFGGMEHTGATLYADRSMFLDEHPTLNEELNRSALIAHETAHMWFGDYVTMSWFDDVWTKEVFANYFSSQMVESLYPAVNHRLNFIRDYIPASYSEDRTAGATPIKQPLDNLSNAGLVYSNIVYDKSPVMMEMLVQQMGEIPYRDGIREYLKTYAYGNATWEGLISILDEYTGKDLQSWSKIWVNEPGMPTLKAHLEERYLVVSQEDPQRKGRRWPQRLLYRVQTGDKWEDVTVEMTQENGHLRLPLHIPVRANTVILPNIDGRGYGYFQLSAHDAEGIFACLDTARDEVLRGSLQMTLFENLQNKAILSNSFIPAMLHYLPTEKNALLYSMALGYVGQAQRLFPIDVATVEQALWQQVEQQPEASLRLQAFRQYRAIAETPEAVQRLYRIWKEQAAPANCPLGENDYIQLSYDLAIRLPQEADRIVEEQATRISNPDRLKEYRFIAPSVSPRQAVRDSVFFSLLKAGNRQVEPWASSALANLNHPLRYPESVEYIRPALDALSEVQRTGDIFFPTAWLRALLSGHHSAEARQAVETFLKEHPDYSPMLKSKILQQADHLYRK